MTIHPIVQADAEEVSSGRAGKGSTALARFRELAERNGYHGHPGGYIKNDATGGTVAHGWSQFARRVIGGNVPLKTEDELDREASETAWTCAPKAVQESRGGQAGQADAEHAGAHQFRPGGRNWRGQAEAGRCAFPDCGAAPGSPVHTPSDVDASHAEAIELDDARDAYAHAGYGKPLTSAEIGAGYADWDAGNVSDYEIGQCRKVGILRRAAVELLAELADTDRPAPAKALADFAAGRFQDVVTDLTEMLAEDLPEVDMDTFLWFLTERGKAALEGGVLATTGTIGGQAGRGKTVTGGLCLRVDAEHVGHMTAVTPLCRTEVHQDPHDAASGAVGRKGYAVGGPMNPDGTYATWGLPNN